MPRLYHKGERFNEISPSALAEVEFEDLLVQNAEIIQANTVIVPFKKTVYSQRRISARRPRHGLHRLSPLGRG